MFSVIIPAAGRGTRMKQDVPKALTPFMGTTFLGWQLQKVKSVAEKIYVVVSAEHFELFAHYRSLHNLTFEIVVQGSGKGSYFAVKTAVKSIQTRYVVVCWVDQVGISESLILRACNSVQIKGVDAIIPLVHKNHPYVKIHRSDVGKLMRWEYRREGDNPSPGFSDVGLFVLNTKKLIKATNSLSDEAKMASPVTQELNFLDFLCEFGKINEIHYVTTEDALNSVAVNTRHELSRAELLVSKTRNQRIFSIIIPSYNEAARLPDLLSQIQKLSDEIRNQDEFNIEVVFVDDGSNDNTRELLSNKPFLYVYQKNSGKGSAVKLGVSHSKGDYIIVLDADGEYLVNEIPLLISCVLKNPTSVVYGSRYLKKSLLKIRLVPLPGQSILNLYFSHFLSLTIGIRFRRIITDSLTGFKVYPRDIYLAIDPATKGFETDHELSKSIIISGIPIVEIQVSYLPRTRAEGKKISVIDAFKALKIWLT
jgi:molybdopterin-guanine dinucleotide biosynthesis protein A